MRVASTSRPGFRAATILVGTLLLLLPAPGTAQAKASSPGSSLSPSASDDHLLDENGLFRVSRLEIPSGETAVIGDSKRDLIITALSDVSLRANSGPSVLASMTSGTARFISRNSTPEVVTNSTQRSQLIVAALKKHWDAEIRECAEPQKCSHPVEVGGAEIGETTLLFTNGFITTYRHSLHRGATLASSYYSSTAKDHLLFIALTDLQASFDGQEEHLKTGQVYTSDAGQVEVTAANDEVRWVLIRINVPKKAD